MGIDRSKRLSFERVADLYAETRLAYPKQMVDDAVALSGIPPGGRILEIGCGPGNATISFAERGYAMTAIELGRDLAEHARRRCGEHRDVEVINAAFEDWPLIGEAFDLVLAVDALHWVPPEVGFPKSAAALRDAGSAVFCWEVPLDPETEWSQAVDEVYERLAPGVPTPTKGFTAGWLVDTITRWFVDSGCFGDVTTREYFWSESVTTAHYVKWLRTLSVHAGLDGSLRETLYSEIGSILDGFGGKIDRLKSIVLFHSAVLR